MTSSTRVAHSVEYVNQAASWAIRHWLGIVNITWGVLVGGPWLAPIAMVLGWTGVANVVYFLYSFLCHQYANRSFFLFGPKLMYSYTELLPYTSDATTWWGLRAFRGNADLGYKVAWSDRMVWLYGSIFLAGLLFALLRGRIRPLSWKLFILMLVPLALDGSTHVISDLFGVGQGFRYTNAWLASLTASRWPTSFYVGNAPGSFNFLMRLITGVMSGVAVVWFAYPRLHLALTGRSATSEGRSG